MYGNEIKQNRIISGLTQKEVESKTGIPQATISWIESDRGIPNVHQCLQLAEAYGISIDELIGRYNNQKSYEFEYEHTETTKIKSKK